jgi:hypothetical protein
VDETIAAYHRLFEMPLEDDMIEAMADLYGWSLGSLTDDPGVAMAPAGGSLIEV